jgi:hypothetical protein
VGAITACPPVDLRLAPRFASFLTGIVLISGAVIA